MSDSPGKTYFSRKARESGFKLDSLEKEYRLMEILHRIQDIPKLSGLALKGGTAIQGLEFGFSRLSVDLDFNFVGGVEREAMIKKRPVISEALTFLLKDLGYHIGPPRDFYAEGRFDAHYTNCGGGRDHLKVEINYLERLPVGGVMKREMANPFEEIGSFSVLSYRAEELFAGKVRALLTRSTARDIYDVNMISHTLDSIDSSLFRQTTMFYLAMQPLDPQNMNVDIIGNVSETDMRNSLLSLLSAKESIDLGRLQAEVINFASGILTLRPEERKFFETLYQDRQVDTDLLFRGSSVAEGLDRHPSILWQLHQLDLIEGDQK